MPDERLLILLIFICLSFLKSNIILSTAPCQLPLTIANFSLLVIDLAILNALIFASDPEFEKINLLNSLNVFFSLAI